MLDHIKIGNILFLDIETVPAFANYQNMPESLKLLWDRKASFITKEDKTPEELYNRAGIYAEFGKIICISTAMLGIKENSRMLKLKSFFSDNEKEILSGISDLITRISLKREIELCAHNGKEFDFPYIARRMLINGISLPSLLDISGKRPWETRLLDTMDMWKFGDHKHYTSLNLLAEIFNIESPKSDIDGSKVQSVYWIDKDIPRIVDYCRRDVIAMVQLVLRFKGEELLRPEEISILDNMADFKQTG